jgi:hypothetical protein
MLVKTAQKLCAALTLGMTMAIASPLKSVAAPVSYEITWDDLYPNNDVVFSFEGEDLDENGIIDSRSGEVLSFELAGLEELGGGAIDLDRLWFDLSWEDFWLDVSNDRFSLFHDGDMEFSVLDDFLNEYGKGVIFDPVVAAATMEQPSPAPAVPPQAIGTEIGGAETASVPEPSLILGFITVGGLMLGSRKKAKA